MATTTTAVTISHELRCGQRRRQWTASTPPKKKIRCGKIDGGKGQLSLKVEEAC
ncbi:BnaCnng14140D [Brassica napus]|uniref:BnaCnng14140D protein n=3 Tax=Brassica TaxID=3705 RepID=A0A078I942_BRANA|nr:BnaCnng14140D [Brassica napus]VDD09580.1 unnamed protein product [Brassica oleracea]